MCMPARLVIGVDPGRTTGLAVLGVDAGELAGPPHAAQLSPGWVVPILASTIREAGAVPVHIGVERFVVRQRAARSRTADAGALTRALIGQIQYAAESLGARVTVRSAADVKPWATDVRLRATGLLEVCTGMPHARDAARHALFTAVHDAGLPDPLIRHRSPR